MRCQDYESLFSQYIDEELALEERDALRFHLNGCHRCQEKLEDMKHAVFAMHNLNTLAPRTEFDDILQRSLKSEITNELYAKSIWNRWAEAFEDLYNFGRQGTVQAVFSASLLMTVTIGLALSYSQVEKGFKESVQLMIPELIEPVLAASQLTTPVPLDNATPAPLMASMVARREVPVKTTLASNALVLSNIVPDLDINALLPLPSGELSLIESESRSSIRTVNAGDRQVSFSLDPFNRNDQAMSSKNTISHIGFINAGSQSHLRSVRQNLSAIGQQRYILPSIPSKKRFTRVSF